MGDKKMPNKLVVVLSLEDLDASESYFEGTNEDGFTFRVNDKNFEKIDEALEELKKIQVQKRAQLLELLETKAKPSIDNTGFC